AAARGGACSWVRDSACQLGDWKPGSRCAGPPLSTVSVAVTGGLSFRTMRASGWDWFTCGVTTSGAAYCWGQGYLGDGRLSADNATPVAVAGGLTFTMLSTGSFHTCGLTLSDDAYCWGDDT